MTKKECKIAVYCVNIVSSLISWKMYKRSLLSQATSKDIVPIIDDKLYMA